MKNIFIFLTCVFTYTNLLAQGIPVSHTIENKNVVLEDFTGMHCPNCPNGHYYANLIETNHPGDVVVINIHTGSYAEPGVGEPDYRTSFGPILDRHSQLTGYPSATVNRHVFTGLVSTAGHTAIVNRANWVTAANQVLTENALANIGVDAKIDVQTSLLTVRVQIYYTGNPLYPGNNHINVALLQNDIEGPQSNSAGNPSQVMPDGNYMHKHMLRHFLTGQWGRQILSTVGAGITIDSTYSYTIPADIRSIPIILGNLQVAVFVTDGLDEVITGHTVNPTFINFPAANSSRVLSAAVKDAVMCGFTIAPTTTIQNFGSSPLTSLYFDYSINGSPVKTMYWTGNIGIMETKEITLDGINFFQDSTNTLTLNTRLPNGVADADAINDEAVVNFNLLPAPDVSNQITMTLMLDYWGSEVSWELVNSGGVVLYQGGPYDDVPNPGSSTPYPSPIIDTFNLSSVECYKFLIHDEYGDGLIGTGRGFTLKDDQNLTLASNYAAYGREGKIVFGIDAPVADSSDVFPPDTTVTPPDTTGTGIFSGDITGGMQVFPNPANESINVSLNFAKEETSTLYLTDLLGKRVKTILENEKYTGSIQVSVADLIPGIYFLNAQGAGKRYTGKILITH